ncbi:MAG TPA: SipW-dependent-type signal peptide-containing protein [Symbiobacteriaceae bacterium]|nr:SipW-dependent-type signal peptide-containing protein [Symbiobacteriaceae bacterium]
MRAKLWLALGVVGMMTLGVTAGTFALFSASAGPNNNQFTAGTLTLSAVRDQGDTIPGPMFYTTPDEGDTPTGVDGLYPTGPWAPGDSRVRVLLVRNTGSLDAWLTSVGADLASGSMYLADKLRYCIATSPIIPLDPGEPTKNIQQPMCPAANGPAPGYVAVGSLGDLINTDHAFDSGNIALNATPGPVDPPKPFYFYVSLPLDADNSYQSETLKVNFYINAVQKKNNP